MSLIDVIIPCFNEGTYIKETLESVLTQTAADKIASITIADDGSDANTLSVLEKLKTKDPRIQILFHKGYGVSKNRNKAATQGHAPWIAFLDGDDLWMPQKLEKQLEAAKEKPEAGLIYTGLAQFSDEDRTPKIARIADLSGSKNLVLDYFLKDGPITSTLLVKRALFEKIGGYREDLSIFEDTEFYVRLAGETSFAFCPEALMQKRAHASSATARQDEMLAHQAFVCFLSAVRAPELAPYVNKRLSRAAWKLGNVSVAQDNKEKALAFYRLAAHLRPTSFIAWASLILLKLGVPLKNIRTALIARRKKSS